MRAECRRYFQRRAPDLRTGEGNAQGGVRLFGPDA